jgi:hypothetical protein
MKILEIQERLLEHQRLKEKQAASPLVERVVQSSRSSHVFGLDPILDADTIEQIDAFKHSNPQLYKKIMNMD